MSISSDLRNLANLAAYSVVPGARVSQSKLDGIRDAALKATADWVRDELIRKRISRPWPPSSAAYQPPATRHAPAGSGSLLASISSKVKNGNALVYVDASMDRSKGRRLSKYANYLESGWILGGRPNTVYRMSKGRRGDVPGRTRDQGVSVPSRTQPPRPYMSLPFRYGEIPLIVLRYRWELRKRLPSELRRLADTAQLKVEYVPPNLSVLM